MLVGLGLAEVRLELGADLVEQLIQAASAAVGGGHAPMAGIHRHCWCLVAGREPVDRRPPPSVFSLSVNRSRVNKSAARAGAMRDAMGGRWAIDDGSVG